MVSSRIIPEKQLVLIAVLIVKYKCNSFQTMNGNLVLAQASKTAEKSKTCTSQVVRTQQDIIKDIRRKHSLVGDKRGKITDSVHRSEFRRNFRKLSTTSECQVFRFYFPDNKKFQKALKKFYEKQEDRTIKYMQVGYVNVNLRLCSRCHDVEKTLKTDLYFVNILDYSSHIRETLCYGCIGAIVTEINGNNCDVESADN